MSTQIIDITNKICPMTTVYVRLALDRAASGERLVVFLKGEETRRNVLTLLETLGQTAEWSVADDVAEGDYRISLCKS
ncbi:sulfurtransferase TusA family protein [Asaia sp. As-1742]|uniref:sulfurtransferase TusA family protein n=1 Tax=Asaia sp. As-1742 TaxID=2608325 RepID=UPI00142258AC|nr:sulfurtransferase TusA family protein [Asaia sp. As-1742]NIE80203.1 sulfurtransferase TusA family protein [Asaia sp. As-1742]